MDKPGDKFVDSFAGLAAERHQLADAPESNFFSKRHEAGCEAPHQQSEWFQVLSVNLCSVSELFRSHLPCKLPGLSAQAQCHRCCLLVWLEGRSQRPEHEIPTVVAERVAGFVLW